MNRSRGIARRMDAGDQNIVMAATVNEKQQPSSSGITSHVFDAPGTCC